VLAWSIAAALSARAAARTLPADAMPQLDREFHAFARAIPTDATLVGYLEAYQDAGSNMAVETFYAAQYALAPHVVEQRVGPEYLIVARGTARPGGDPRLDRYVELFEFPGGHRLFRRIR
jgi:hypothetical protein